MTTERLFRWLSALLLAALLGLMLGSFRDYGITEIEPVQQAYGESLVRWYATLGEDRGAIDDEETNDLGGFFELTVQAAQRVSPFGTYETRHLVNALFAFVGVLAAWWTGYRLSGPLGAFLSALFLAATPLFYGHAFSNPRDLPFASLFALGTAGVVLLRIDRPPGPGWPVLIDLLMAGTAIGLACAVRVAGLWLLACAAVPWLASVFLTRRDPLVAARRPLWRDLGRVGLDLAILGSTAWLVMVLLWPYAQADPFRNPLVGLLEFPRQGASVPVLYDGRSLISGEIPAGYAAWWFALTLPEFHALALALGAWRIAHILRRSPLPASTHSKLRHFAWLAFVVLLPLAWVSASGVPLYNGVRHLLFLVPGLAVLSGVSAAWWLRGPFPVALRSAGAVALALLVLVTVRDMLELHPYQALYFNRAVAGGLPTAGASYDTDYWCASCREGAEWVAVRYAEDGGTKKLRVAGPGSPVQLEQPLAEAGRDGRFEVVRAGDSPDVLLAPPARDPRGGVVVHRVERQGFPLLEVRDYREAR